MTTELKEFRKRFALIDKPYSKGLKAYLQRELEKLSPKELCAYGVAAANAALMNNACTKCSRSVAEYLLRWQAYSDERIQKQFPSKIAYLVNSTAFVLAIKSGHKTWAPITKTKKIKIGV